MSVLVALTRNDIADYVEALFLVYLILIFARILLSWIPRLPYNRYLRAVVDFIHQVTDPYLNLFLRAARRWARLRARSDPIIAVVVLLIAQTVVVNLIADEPRRRLAAGPWARPRRGRRRPGLEGDRRVRARAGERVDLVLGFELVVRNTRIAFGLLADGQGLVLAVTGIAVLLILGYFALNPARPGLWVGVGLLVGGAIRNLADRVRVERVDFIDPPAWPAFNVADIAIVGDRGHRLDPPPPRRHRR